MNKGPLITFSLLLFIPFVFAQDYPHRDYDWEGDGDVLLDLNPDLAKEPPQDFESCFACHYGGMFPKPGFKRKKCEDCHTMNVSTGAPNGPYRFYDLKGGSDFNVSDDYEVPLVYSHLSIQGPSNYSSCLIYDPVTGEGVCHGISFDFKEKVGGYYAFNATETQFPLNDPYFRSYSSEHFPDSRDCLYCHNQEDNDVKLAWGSPPQIRISWVFNHYNATVSEDCDGCHVTEGAFINFHSRGIYVEDRKSYRSPILVIGGLIVLMGIVALLRRKKR